MCHKSHPGQDKYIRAGEGVSLHYNDSLHMNTKTDKVTNIIVAYRPGVKFNVHCPYPKSHICVVYGVLVYSSLIRCLPKIWVCLLGFI